MKFTKASKYDVIKIASRPVTHLLLIKLKQIILFIQDFNMNESNIRKLTDSDPKTWIHLLTCKFLISDTFIILLLFIIIMDMNEHNIQRLTDWVSKSHRLRDPKSTIDLATCKFLNTETVMNCPVCLEIPRFPLIFPCGHLECNNCYKKDFKLRARRRGTDFYTLCPLCRAEVNPELVITVSTEVRDHPSSKVSKFYNELSVRCENMACNEFIPFFRITQHEIFECSKRDIQCPARNCPCIGKPNEIIIHTINCPLHQIYCQNCNSHWPVTVFGHNCNKTLLAKLLSNFTSISNTDHFSIHRVHPHDCVVLPHRRPIINLEEETLTEILNVVRINRGRLLLGRNSDIPEDITELPPAPPAYHRSGYDVVDEGNSGRDMLDTARDLAF